jgi:hypothetical protein
MEIPVISFWVNTYLFYKPRRLFIIALNIELLLSLVLPLPQFSTVNFHNLDPPLIAGEDVVETK